MDLIPEPAKIPKRNDLRAEVERLTSLMRTVDLFGTGFVWTDPRTGLEHVLHPADVVVVLRADTQTEFEKIKEAAYRAGREDAARLILDEFEIMKNRAKDITDRKASACARVGLSMAALKVIEMSDRWAANQQPRTVKQGDEDSPEEGTDG